MADVDTQGVDFADIAGVVGGLGGLTSLIPPSKNPKAVTTGNVLTTVLNNPQLLGLILGLFQSLGGLFKKKPKPTEVPTEPITVAPVPVPTPPTPAPVTSTDKITALKSKWYFFERTEHGSQVLNKGTYDDIIAGNQFLTRGDRLHVDITPLIGSQVMGPESSRKDELLLQDPSKGDVEGNHRFIYVAVVNGKEYRSGDVAPGENWDGQDVVFLTSEYDDYGCTPVLTVNRDLGLNAEYSVSFYAIYKDKDGREVTSNKLPTVRVKPWQTS